MIKVSLFVQNQAIMGFEIMGHAGYADAGEDIVCAAVSVLATTTVNSLKMQLTQSPIYQVDEKEGCLECSLPPDLSEDDYSKAQIILKTLEIGLKSIEQEYGNYIRIKQRRWNKC